MDTCIYEIDYEYHSNCSFVFDVHHMRALVEAPEGISRDQMQKLCSQKFLGFAWLNGFHKADITKLV
jgi:hypothetical protein